jgi:hypothetical protein
MGKRWYCDKPGHYLHASPEECAEVTAAQERASRNARVFWALALGVAGLLCWGLACHYG